MTVQPKNEIEIETMDTTKKCFVPYYRKLIDNDCMDTVDLALDHYNISKFSAQEQEEIWSELHFTLWSSEELFLSKLSKPVVKIFKDNKLAQPYKVYQVAKKPEIHYKKSEAGLRTLDELNHALIQHTAWSGSR